MKRAVFWTQEARDDYLGVVRFIAKNNPDAAARVGQDIDRAVTNLGDLAIGRPGRVAGTYEKIVSRLPYIIAYTSLSNPKATR